MAPVFSDSQLLGWDPKYPGDYFLDGRAVGQDSLDLILEKWFQLIDGSYFLNEILFNWGKTYTYTFDSESFSVGVPSVWNICLPKPPSTSRSIIGTCPK